MKNYAKTLAQINVLGCEPKMQKDKPTRQELDNDGNPLWLVDVLEEFQEEKYGLTQTNVVKYKSILELSEGNNIVMLKAAHVGGGSGTFISVNSYYKIMSVLDEKLALRDVFAHQGVTVPSQRPGISDAQMGEIKKGQAKASTSKVQ